MVEGIEYRRMNPGEEGEVCELVKQVFDQFVAPGFSQKGIVEFFRYANPAALSERCASDHVVLVAAKDERIIGMIELAQFRHVAMLFVSVREQGIARELVRGAVSVCKEKDPGISRITVHASRYAEPIYERLGFRTTGTECTERGIRYVPMGLELGPDT